MCTSLNKGPGRNPRYKKSFDTSEAFSLNKKTRHMNIGYNLSL